MTPDAISSIFTWSFPRESFATLPIERKVFHGLHYVIKLCNKEKRSKLSNLRPACLQYDTILDFRTFKSPALPKLTSGKDIAGSKFASERGTCALAWREMEVLLQWQVSKLRKVSELQIVQIFVNALENK